MGFTGRYFPLPQPVSRPRDEGGRERRKVVMRGQGCGWGVSVGGVVCVWGVGTHFVTCRAEVGCDALVYLVDVLCLV